MPSSTGTVQPRKEPPKDADGAKGMATSTWVQRVRICHYFMAPWLALATVTDDHKC